MQEHRFSEGREVTISTLHQQPGRKPAVPYDNSLKYNRVVDKKPNDPSSIIYSIDALAILRELDGDKLEKLSEITLACKSVRTGLGMWDTLFNSANRASMNACVFTAQADYTPIPQSRVVVASHYLNLGMEVSRIFLNEIILGDKLGIGIYDLSNQTTYILIYGVDELCSVTAPPKTKEERPGSIPAVNCGLIHIAKLGHDGVTKVLDFDEDTQFDAEALMPFLSHITNAIYDVNKGYPWKPHFMYTPVKDFNRVEVEERLLRFTEKAIEVTYDDFIEVCRTAYHKAKPPKLPWVAPDTIKPVGRRRPKARGQTNTPITPARYIPKVEVFTMGGQYYATLDDESNPQCDVYTFSKDGLGSDEQVEVFLVGRDLEGVDLLENPRAIALSSDKFGDDAFMRYLELGF